MVCTMVHTMARFTVYLPDHLHQRARDELPPDLSWSSVLAEGIIARLECDHPALQCVRCHQVVDADGAHHGVHLDEQEPPSPNT